ncbi:MAG TPA: hypothetical protein PKE45_18705 [Caldilineaceae bacterium]|nr:hypothetical protein [Caldilineaceae bacterium]
MERPEDEAQLPDRALDSIRSAHTRVNLSSYTIETCALLNLTDQATVYLLFT